MDHNRFSGVAINETSTEQVLRFVIEERAAAIKNLKTGDLKAGFTSVESHRVLRMAMRQFSTSAREQRLQIELLIRDLDQRIKKKPFFFRKRHEELLRADRKLAKTFAAQLKSSTELVKALEGFSQGLAQDM